MSKLSPPRVPSLQRHYFPPVNHFEEISQDLIESLKLSPNQQHCRLRELRKDPERYGQVLHDSLAQIYAYRLGYRDSPCYLKMNESLERQLDSTKLTLEAELLNNGLPVEPIPQRLSQSDAAKYLNTFATDNSGVKHPLFDYLEIAPRKGLLCFLQHEVMRNEVVDDEVSLLVAGLQGQLKMVAAANLWDECGRGKLTHAHTYMLRRYLEATNGWQELADYRRASPWFSKITSNVFMMLLTRPGLKLSAYGYFLMSESSVAPHFEKILAGLARADLTQKDVTIYFDAHLKIDKRHGQELIDGIRYQEPCLMQEEIDRLLQGANLYLGAATLQYDRMLSYLLSLE